MSKKKWTKPQLIVLVRGRPEERVLEACKGGAWDGPVGWQTVCEDNTCVACSIWYGGS